MGVKDRNNRIGMFAVGFLVVVAFGWLIGKGYWDKAQRQTWLRANCPQIVDDTASSAWLRSDHNPQSVYLADLADCHQAGLVSDVVYARLTE
jgi:hypothetical protein